MFFIEVQPVVVVEKPIPLAVQLDRSSDGLGWHLTAMNTTQHPISGDVQVEWRVPEAARGRVLLLTSTDATIERAFVVDSLPINRPESYLEHWIGERFPVNLKPGAWVVLNGSVIGSPDVDQDGIIGGGDVANVLSSWGENCCQADVDCNGIVEMADLVLVLGAVSGA